ncbi:hypothetical protein ACWEKM_24670 [Streptomyces sp. NPDC004752]
MTRPLSLEICLLTPSTAPAQWTAAVAEAVRLLAPSWDDSPAASDELRTLALVLFARTRTGGRTPQDVSLGEIVAALAVPGDGVLTEALAVREEIESALAEAALTPAAGTGSHPVWTIYWGLCEVYRYPMIDDFEPEPPSPSPLRQCLPSLARRLTGMTEEARSALEPVSVEAEALRVDTTRVMIVSRHAEVRLDCWTDPGPTKPGRPARCPAEVGGHLMVDGPDAVWVCNAGHRTRRPRTLSAAHARNALRQLGIDPATRGQVDAGGPFCVPAGDAFAEDADPTKLFALSVPRPPIGRDKLIEDVTRLIEEQQNERGPGRG